jgi:hypothetical protein
MATHVGQRDERDYTLIISNATVPEPKVIYFCETPSSSASLSSLFLRPLVLDASGYQAEERCATLRHPTPQLNTMIITVLFSENGTV